MSLHTTIEWCDSTVNPTMGCDGCELWVPSHGVKICYAGVLTERRGGKVKGYPRRFEVPELFPGRMAEAAAWSDLTGKPRPDKPWLDGMPRVIFISDMGDSPSSSVPFNYLRDEVVATVTSAQGRRHVWPWLTKQLRRMAQFAAWLQAQGIAWPDNLWALTSVTSQAQAARVRHLLRVPARVRGISYEPALGPVNWCRGVGEPSEEAWDEVSAREALSGEGAPEEFEEECEIEGDWVNCGRDLVPNPTYREWLHARREQAQYFTLKRGIDWVIIGGASGPGAGPLDLAWVRDSLAFWREAKVPVFVKQLGSVPVMDEAAWRAAPLTRLLSHRNHRRAPAGTVPLAMADPKGGNMVAWPEDLRVRQMPACAAPSGCLQERVSDIAAQGLELRSGQAAGAPWAIRLAAPEGTDQ